MQIIVALLVSCASVCYGMSNCGNCGGHHASLGSGITISSVSSVGFSPPVTSLPTGVPISVPSYTASVTVNFAFAPSSAEGYVDLCQLVLTTKFVDKIYVNCAGQTDNKTVIIGTGMQTTTFDFASLGGDTCTPDLSASCTFTIHTPTAEAGITGFDLEACYCCIDCVQNDWTPWVCSVTCGKGTATRTRTVKTPPNFCGQQCGPDKQTQDCEFPVIDCVQNDWTPWVCSVTCGKGTATRTRTVKTPPNACGEDCGPEKQTQDCEFPVIDCVLNDWTPWVCSVTCGKGTATRTRSVKTPPNACGEDCGPQKQTQECEFPVIDCKLGPWTEWNCDAVCGQGTSTRTRAIVQAPNICGSSCDHTIETTGCFIPCCLKKDRYRIDCSQNKDDIVSVAIEPQPGAAGEVVYTQDPWLAVAYCGGKLWLAKNSKQFNEYKMTIVPTNVYKVCIETKWTPKVTLTLYDSADSIVKQLSRSTTVYTNWQQFCFDYNKISDFGAQNVSQLKFSFDNGDSNEWMIRNIYIIACPPVPK